MQRTLPALLAALFAGGAYAADATVTLYGIANAPLSYMMTQGVNGAANVNQLAIGNPNAPSRIGFRGEEDLGGGLKAFFQIEQAVRLDDASTGAFASREGWVGLSGDFGKFGLGRGKSPYHNFADTWDGMVAGERNMSIWNHGQLGLVFQARPNNTVRYDSNNLSGFTFAGALAMGENKTAAVGATRTATVSGKYTSGPLMIGAAYERASNLDAAGATTAAAVSGNDNSLLLVGGTYTVGGVKLGAAFQRAETDRISAGTLVERDADSWLVNATYPIDKWTLKAGAIFNQEVELKGKGDLAGTDYVRYTMGANYSFSKRTTGYIEYSGDNYDKNLTGGAKGDIKALSVGLMHSF